MTVGYCSFCNNSSPPLDSHHLAGHVNQPMWTVRVCKSCHFIFTAWQYADRVPLSKEADSPDRVKWVAIVQGLARATELMGQLEGMQHWVSFIASLAKVYADRATSPSATRLYSDDGSYPKLKATNPAPVPGYPIMGINRQRLVAAQCAMLAFILEEFIGYEHRLCAKLRAVEHFPMSYRFIDDPPVFDFTSDDSLKQSIARQLNLTFLSAMDDLCDRFVKLSPSNEAAWQNVRQ